MIKKFVKRTVQTYIMYRVAKWLNYEPVVGNRKVRYPRPRLRRIK